MWASAVKAVFRPATRVQVSLPGTAAGRITSTPAGINCGTGAGQTACTFEFFGRTTVTLTRTLPAVGTTFRWLGACADRGTGPACSMALPADPGSLVDVGARYGPQQFALSISPRGPGTVRGSALPARSR